MNTAQAKPQELLMAFMPMNAEHLDVVTAHEASICAFPWSRGNFADALTAGYSSWVAAKAGELASYAVVMHVLDEAHLLNIGVVQCCQRQGLGRRMIAHLLQVSRTHGAIQMFLEVRPSNLPAHGLYRALGFEEIGRRKGYYPAHDGREDAIVMRLAL